MEQGSRSFSLGQGGHWAEAPRVDRRRRAGSFGWDFLCAWGCGCKAGLESRAPGLSVPCPTSSKQQSRVAGQATSIFFVRAFTLPAIRSPAALRIIEVNRPGFAALSEDPFPPFPSDLQRQSARSAIWSATRGMQFTDASIAKECRKVKALPPSLGNRRIPSFRNSTEGSPGLHCRAV
jgi:hypothetical protein